MLCTLLMTTATDSTPATDPASTENAEIDLTQFIADSETPITKASDSAKTPLLAMVVDAARHRFSSDNHGWSTVWLEYL